MSTRMAQLMQLVPRGEWCLSRKPLDEDGDQTLKGKGSVLPFLACVLARFPASFFACLLSIFLPSFLLPSCSYFFPSFFSFSCFFLSYQSSTPRIHTTISPSLTLPMTNVHLFRLRCVHSKSNDDPWVCAAAGSGRAWVLDRRTGQILHSWLAHDQSVVRIRAFDNKQVRLWNPW